jgi:CHAT domain-containing protein/tetratricopeptide (TPR) repeat protein
VLLLCLLFLLTFNAPAARASPDSSTQQNAIEPEQRSLRAALAGFEQALTDSQTTSNEPKQIDALLGIARTEYLLRDPVNCRKTLDRAAQVATNAHDTLGEAKVTDGYALLDDAEKNEPQALQDALRSADLFHTAGSLADETAVRFWLASVYQKLGDVPNTTATYERLVPLADMLKNPSFQALVRLRLGQQYNLQPNVQARRKSLALLAQALPYFEAAPDGGLNAILDLWTTGTAYSFLHDSERARNAYAEALARSAQTQDRPLYGRLAADTGEEEVRLKQWSQARQHLEAALRLLTGPADVATRFVVGIDLGTTREALNDTAGAIAAYALTAADSHRAGDGASEATSWLKTAAVYDRSFDWADAIAFDMRAVAAARYPDGGAMLPAALLSLSNDYLNDGEQQRSLETGLEALPLLHGDDRLSELTAIAINYSWLGQFSKALAALNLGLSESAPDTAQRAGLLAVFAEVHTSLADVDAALREADQARAIYHKLRIPNGEAKALNQLGLVYQAIGDKTKSLAALDAALANERANANVFGQCATLNNLGDLQRYFGDFQKAEPLYLAALAAATQIADRYQQASILQNLGLDQHGLGRETDALASLHRALGIRRELADPNSEAKVLSAIGLVDIDIGQPQEGLDALLEGLAKLQGSDDIASRASVLNDLGYAYRHLGAYNDAAIYLQQARDLGPENDKDSRATIEGNLASLELYRALTPGHSAQFKADSLARAAALYAKVLHTLAATGDKLGQTIVLNSEAVIVSEQGNQQAALGLLSSAEKLAAETGDVDARALVEHTTGTVYAKLGDQPAALRHFALALPLWREIGEIDGEEQTLFVTAKAERQEGKPDEALRDVKQAIALSSDVRARVMSDERRAALFAAAGPYYEFEIDLLMQFAQQYPGRGYEAQAFEACESGRARSLLDLLAESHANVRRGVDPALLNAEKSLENQLAAKQAVRNRFRPSADAAPDAQQLEDQIAALSSQYDLVEAKIRAAGPAYAALTQPQPLAVKDVQNGLLDADTILLEYSLGEDRSYLWAVTRDSVSVYQLPPRRQIEDAAGELFRLIGEKDTENAAAAAAKLGNILVAPAAHELKYRIVVVADGELQRTVPFALLPEPRPGGSGPLLAEHEIVTEPSAAVAAALRRSGAGRAQPANLLAVVADPVYEPGDDRLGRLSQAPSATPTPPQVAATFRRLQNSAIEARAILGLARAEQEFALIGFDANKATVVAAKLGMYRVVHFATHGYVNDERPALSGLALSSYDKAGQPIDGLLTLNDVYNLELPVNLVVLSACDSGTGEVVGGEGIIGLTRGFMYAGAGSVLVSMWNVNDESTAELMERFYQKYLADGGTHPAAALRAAQLSMLHDNKWNAPYYWAAFSVQGDWR